jgi:hypothetical protein
MTRLPALFTALLLGFAISCSSDDDDGSDTNNTTASSQSTSNTTGSMTTAAETTGDQECNTSHLCVGDACHCTTPGKEDDPCDNDMACEMQCEVCM